MPAGEQSGFKPALTLSRAVVSWVNEIAAARKPLQSRLSNKSLFVRMERLVWDPEPCAVPMFDCVWAIGNETIILSLPDPFVQGLIATVQSGLGLPSEPTRSLLVEFALDPLLDQLESLTQQSLQLICLSEARARGPYLELEITYGPFKGKARLFLFLPLDGAVPSAFRALLGLVSQLPREERQLPPELPVIIKGEIGSLCATVALLRKANAGDALLPDVIHFARGQAILNAGPLCAPAHVAEDRLIVRGAFRHQPHPLECVHMMTQSEKPRPPSESDLDNIEITVIFECGRWTVALGALRNINEGHVFELGRPFDGTVDILANGRRIGRGDIVRIGEELGIRLRGKLAVND
ncbi:type III secretion system cytoplasmic ring protein SctQ [Bradyrhizobium sp. CB3481]|uniref:type III secretion system cytoplasmic ring protein SctQ n=1 Tax=Bradyrhizobium sp. CB3481 TaxID=3039158 RepID=UPI0024B15978|nr:type III secretion system cytoplasmic ring protein SctQ [Bradyrhizobium sp. CB3481]WFU20626.1 type III secretion system cytoplasmic ring protein SctQ [Bradyrhizobium sp. CB3481]